MGRVSAMVPPSRRLGCALWSIGREPVNLDLDTWTTAHDLKLLAFSLWNLPTECQTLKLNDACLHDTVDLLDYWGEDISDVRVVVEVHNVEEIYRRLEDADAEERRVAVEMLIDASQRGDERAVYALAACLKD